MEFVFFLTAAVKAGTCLLYATLGEIISEKVGHLNLGVEGMMQMGAVVGFIAGFTFGNPYIAVLCAALAGACGALIYGFLTISLKANQVVTGLTLSIFGVGFAAFFGKNFVGKKVPEAITTFLPRSSCRFWVISHTSDRSFSTRVFMSIFHIFW